MPIRGGKAYRQHTTYKEAIRQRDGYKCQLCGCGIGDVCDRHWAQVSQLDVAHIISFKDGGLSIPDNQRTLCHPCNKREDYGTQHTPAIVRDASGQGLIAAPTPVQKARGGQAYSSASPDTT
mgnify:CR=1 FL=1